MIIKANAVSEEVLRFVVRTYCRKRRRKSQTARNRFFDILLLHRPDTLMEPEEVNKAFSYLDNQGMVRAFGVSNMNPMQTELLQNPSSIRFCSTSFNSAWCMPEWWIRESM